MRGGGAAGVIQRINPLVPVDLVIDHRCRSITRGRRTRCLRNVRVEFDRNRERYTFLRWGQNAVQLPRRAAGFRHRASGQPGVPGAWRHDQGRPYGHPSPIPILWWAPTRTRR